MRALPKGRYHHHHRGAKAARHGREAQVAQRQRLTRNQPELWCSRSYL
jgi:hypothetical protein